MEVEYLVDYPVVQNALVTGEFVEKIPTDKELLIEYFGSNWQTFHDLAFCESRNRQFDSKGAVITSSTKDYGYLQINQIWSAKADQLGLDFKSSLADNIRMAKYVYQQQGLKAWSCYDIIKNYK